MSRQINLAVIPGDGIGPEVVDQALAVLEAVTRANDTRVAMTHFSLGADRYRETGDVLPDDDLESLRTHDAILLGAVGGDPRDPRLADGIIERGLLLRLRFAFDQYANVRPAVLYPSVASPLAAPGEIDFVIIREATEGSYISNGGILRRDTSAEVASEVSINTAFGVERVVRFAFARAAARPRKKLTLVHKTNVLTFAGSLWRRTVEAVASEFADVEVDYFHVDAATIAMVTNPSAFDVIVTDNLFGDIVTDLAAAICGGIGLAASANINPDGAFPSMFEPVHGSAPDIAGQQRADPTAAILSVALLLNHLGMSNAADHVTSAVKADLATRGDRGSRTTREIGNAIISHV